MVKHMQPQKIVQSYTPKNRSSDKEKDISCQFDIIEESGQKSFHIREEIIQSPVTRAITAPGSSCPLIGL